MSDNQRKYFEFSSQTGTFAKKITKLTSKGKFISMPKTTRLIHRMRVYKIDNFLKMNLIFAYVEKRI